MIAPVDEAIEQAGPPRPVYLNDAKGGRIFTSSEREKSITAGERCGTPARQR
jgi:hypothetical protein